MKVKATLDDYSSPDGNHIHRQVSVETEHEQVTIKSGRDKIEISKRALATVARLVAAS